MDTLANESVWHVDRYFGNWQTDYRVLPPGASSFTDSNVAQGTYPYTYRIRPTNAHQTPAYSNEVEVHSLPLAPPCVSAYTVYTNLCSVTGDPSLCPQNQGGCGGEIEMEMQQSGGSIGPEGMGIEMEQMSSGGGGIDPTCCEPSNVVVIKWEAPVGQFVGTIQGFWVMRGVPGGGGDYWRLKSNLDRADTTCLDFNHPYTFSVATQDVFDHVSDPVYPFVEVMTGWRDWCNGGDPLEKRASDANNESGAVPHRFALSANRPNPLNSGTVLAFTLAQTESWKIEVLDVLGRVVWTDQGVGSAGPIEVAFDGRDGSGCGLASGTYFWRVTTPSASGVRKMTIVK